ncbi:MAG: hypothetical protein EA377_12995 [Phycisphaerales bacterium]|nr:MAG: hypothetical protein EA377_12995 [Phycisphaerales bacterium]
MVVRNKEEIQMISRPINTQIVARTISILFTLLMLLMPGHRAIAQEGAVLHVPSDYGRIQLAIDAAPPGGAKIIVAPGSYGEAIDTLGKSIYLKSSDGPNATTINATGRFTSAVNVKSGEGPAPIIEGFTITSGFAGVGGGIRIQHDGTNVIDCIITGNFASSAGGGIQNLANDVLIKDTLFENNDAELGGGLWNDGGALTVEDSVIKNNTADTGGGIFHAASIGMITGTTIADNSADLVGGVYVQEQSHLILIGDSFFCGNEPDDIGGSGAWKNQLGNEFLNSCEVTYHVPADYADIQDAIDAIDAKSAFGAEIVVAPGTYNQPINTGGKAVHLKSEAGPENTIIDVSELNTNAVQIVNGEGPDTIIEGFTITGGNPSGSGGGLAVLSSSPTVIDCVFENNSSGLNGGGIRVSAAIGDANVEFLGNTVIKNNTAVGFGGGLSVDQGANVEIVGELHVEDNTAEFAGGGIALVDSDVIFPGDTFITNNSAEVGGGIAISGGVIDFPGDTFVEDNEADFGGGISLIGGDVTFPGDTFITNNTAGTGGGIVAEDGTIEFPGDTFVEDNEADFGGGIALIGGDVTFPGDTFITNNTAGSGGGIYVGDDGTIAMHDLTGSPKVVNNSASQGGGLYNEGEASIDEGLFENNHANAGGGVYNAGGGTLSVQDMEFVGNSAGDDDTTLLTTAGGAIASEMDATTEIGDSTFCQNTPTDISGPWNDLGGNTFSAPADLNCDGVVDVFDLLTLLEDWGACSDPADCPADLNDDGVIDVFDLLILLENWG